MEYFKTGQEVRVLEKCRHIFHKNCIDKWLRVKGQCPIDRRQLNVKV